jgi:hypothetical protein
MKRAAAMFALNFVLYLFLVWNYRAVAQARYGDAAASDMLIAMLGFTAVKRIAEATTLGERVGYILGGGAAAVVGIWLTVHRFGG